MDGPGGGQDAVLRGRLIEVVTAQGTDPARVRVASETGVRDADVTAGLEAVRVGDLVAITDGRVTRLTATRASEPGVWMRRILDPRRRAGVAVRARVEDGVRAFFRGRGFLEVHTPLLVPCPGTEPHIRPFVVPGAGALRTSPELHMKRLLVGGLERIFQLGPVFRDEPAAPTHRREFTLLEWYRAYQGLGDIRADTEELVATLARALHGRTAIPRRTGPVDVTPPWPRLRLPALFSAHGIDLARATSADLCAACARLDLHTAPGDDWDALVQRVWLGVIEPALPAHGAVFVEDFPPSQAALATLAPGPDGALWARRVEAFVGGLELANGFDELTAAPEQRARFAADQAARRALHGDAIGDVSNDEDFLSALEDGMPPAAGIALGVDRLVMLLGDEPDIEFTRWLW